MYSGYDPSTSRSPGAHRNPPPAATLHRMPSRQFDPAYAPPPSMYPRPYDDQEPRSFDRLSQTMHAAPPPAYGYDMAAHPAWNTPAFSHTALGSLGTAAAARIKSHQQRGTAGAGGRSALPSAWMDPPPQGLPSFALPSLGSPNPNLNAMPAAGYGHDTDEELIPTAIVIKNIPFAVKKEQLVQLMTDLRLPLPYAFNYHFDNGVFRGLAFANFTTADETAAVIESMNHFELNGRKLRVEYKKMLPLAERERIEREKRERRGQLEEQHRPLGGTLQSQASFGSLASHIPATSPSPVSAMRGGSKAVDVDLNDPQVLQFYSQLLLFKETPDRDSMTFPNTLAPLQRRTIHTLAHQLGLAHVSKGTGESRQVHIFKVHDNQGLSPPMPQMPLNHMEQPRRNLNRAATTDFSDVRAEGGFYGGFNRQPSGLLGFPDSPGGLNAVPNLRGAKSYADLRSYTPSPAPSTASHPVGRPGGLQQALDGLGYSGSSTNPNGTPSASSLSQREDSLLEREMSRMQLGNSFGQGNSPRALRQMTSWDAPGPIGGHRAFGNNNNNNNSSSSNTNTNTNNYDDRPSRQPRGPLPERGQGFARPRQNGHQNRGSDELSSQSNVEILVGQ